MSALSSRGRHRVTFQRRRRTRDDGHGMTEGEWCSIFSVAAGIRPLKGGEDVLAARLTGVQPVIITVGKDRRTEAVTSAWRAVDEAGRVYAITAPPADMEGKGLFLDILASSGVAS